MSKSDLGQSAFRRTAAGAAAARSLQLQSYIGGRFVGARAGVALASAIDGRVVAHAHADELDFGEAVAHARGVGVRALLELDFQQRALRA